MGNNTTTGESKSENQLKLEQIMQWKRRELARELLETEEQYVSDLAKIPKVISPP